MLARAVRQAVSRARSGRRGAHGAPGCAALELASSFHARAPVAHCYRVHCLSIVAATVYSRVLTNFFITSALTIVLTKLAFKRAALKA